VKRQRAGFMQVAQLAMKHATTLLERLIGRHAEAHQLETAIRERRSQLIWGPKHSGKTFLIANVLAELPASASRKRISVAGPATRRQLVEHLVRELFLAGDPFVRKKVQADRCDDSTLSRWVSEQSALRLRGILFTAAEQGDYCVFLDHLASVSHAFAGLLKEIMYRTKTPVYLTGHGYSHAEIGYAWSLYWSDEYRVHLGPLPEVSARELLESCIDRFALRSLDRDGFREQILRFSGNLPGAIVKMCELAANPRYHYGDRVKLKLVQMDYLLQSHRLSSATACPS
jgi:Cdc6-like AAA superfamily ATPase